MHPLVMSPYSRDLPMTLLYKYINWFLDGITSTYFQAMIIDLFLYKNDTDLTNKH